MRRLWLFLAALTVFALLAVQVVEIDTDARAVLGPDSPAADALDSPEGRRQLLALTGADRAGRQQAAQELAAAFTDHPLVQRIETGPRAPDPAVIDFLWGYRLALAPPQPEAFTTEALGARLAAARAELGSLTGASLAGKMLLDPTGSFAALVERLRATGQQATPGATDAATLVLTLTDAPFDPTRQSALDHALGTFAEARGLELLSVGPRSISARISADISARARWTGMLGTALLILWLGLMLRSLRALIFLVLPAAAGIVGASLAVQAAFGGVHVLAFGFGGALMGLALDYPLHLMTHPRDAASRTPALRWILMGALTTAIAFLSLLGAGLPAVGQIGVFVAIGLLIAAGASSLLGGQVPHRPPSAWMSRWDLPRSRWKLPVMAGLLSLALAGLWAMPEPGQQSLVHLPDDVRADLARMDGLVGLPSGQHGIEVAGRDPGDVLDRQRALTNALDGARQAGELARWAMLADLAPTGPGATPGEARERLADNIGPALAMAGLDPAFGAQILGAFDEAGRSLPEMADIEPLLATTDLAGVLSRQGERLVSSVQLWGVRDADGLARRITALGDADIRWVDRTEAMHTRLDAITTRVLWCLVIGALAGLAVLALLLGRARPVLDISLASATAVAVTALITGLAGQSGIFALLALALVVGIGIDYGLFLGLSRGQPRTRAAMASVGLCAGTTLIAFGVMAASGVALLEEIGTTVIVGIVAMLMVHAVRDGAAEDDA